MFYEDLSPYQYQSVPTGLPGVFNVGWLGSSAPQVGDIDEDAAQRIVGLCEAPIIITRGHHICGLCNGFNGNGEVWIPGDNGRVYASPTMLAHYVTAHRYLTPPEFLKAVTSGLAPLTEDECWERIAYHKDKLNHAPEPEDILVPYYSVQVYWRLVDFNDLTAFYKFATEVSWFDRFAVDERGYYVQTESYEPEEVFHRLVKVCKGKKPVPFQCAFKLVYVGKEEVLYPAEPLIVEPPNKFPKLKSLLRWLKNH